MLFLEGAWRVTVNETTQQGIASLAARQRGVVTRAQLLTAGLTSSQVDSRVRSGRLRPVHRGVYLLGDLRGSLEPPWAREIAATLACGSGSLVSHRSAAGLWKLAPRPPRSAPVEVVIPGDRTPCRRPGIVARRTIDLASGDIASVAGIPVTAPVRTICDLATVADSGLLERAIARAERASLMDMAELSDRVARRGGRRGVRVLRAVLDQERGPAFTRSEAESRFLDLVRDTGLPHPEVNATVAGFEVDFLWRDRRIAIEVDGFAYHSSRQTFAADRRRDAELFARVGVRVLRITWDQIVHKPKRTLVTLTRALDRAAGHDLGRSGPCNAGPGTAGFQ